MKTIVAQGVPVAVGVAMYALGAPWYLCLLLLVGAQYWFGPILLYFSQRMPSSSPLRTVPAATPLPGGQEAFVETTTRLLEATGFEFKGCLTNNLSGEAIHGTVTLMQHRVTSDVAHLLVVVKNGQVAKTMGFSRSRTGGGRIRTSWSTVRSPFRPNPLDNTLVTAKCIDPLDLWRVHEARVAADTSAMRDTPITDPLQYQMNAEREGIETKVASGWWQQAGQQGFLRPTVKGAVLMCLRMLFPWKHLDNMRAERIVRRLLEERKEMPAVKDQEIIPVVSTEKGQHPDLPTGLVADLKLLASSEKKSGSLGLLIVTVIVFFSAQVISTKWQDVVILVGVLLFHELGHLAAMKLLRYTDLKMFFIPFMGAAVSGTNRNQTALKSCIVSLLGPLPGIVLSVFLYITFFLTKNYYVLQTAKVMILLNVFNLLPIMPLDGGRFVDVLFVNRRHFRFVFSLLGAAAFLAMAVSSHAFFLGLLGILTIGLAVSNLKLHSISNDLKSEGISAASVTELIHDEDSLKHVLERIRPRFPKLFSPNIDAKGIFNKLTVVVDTLKYKPARFLPKAALLTTYVICTLASVVGMFLFIAFNYKEVSRTVSVEGKNYLYVEHHIFGKKRSECLINNQLYYDGKGTVYDTDGSVSGIFYYKNGYRTGEWVNFAKSGEEVEKEIYENGRLRSLVTFENGTWKNTPVEAMPMLKRWAENVRALSQPFKSNHEYF